MRKTLIICILLFSCCFVYSKESNPKLTITKWITANPPDLNNLPGQVYVVEFWTTWCKSCIRSIPHLNELTEKYKNVPFISITPNTKEKKLRKIIKKHKIKYHVAFGGNSIDAFDVRSYPTAFVINRKGKIVWRGMPFNLDFEKAIQKALKQKEEK